MYKIIVSSSKGCYEEVFGSIKEACKFVAKFVGQGLRWYSLVTYGFKNKGIELEPYVADVKFVGRQGCEGLEMIFERKLRENIV